MQQRSAQLERLLKLRTDHRDRQRTAWAAAQRAEATLQAETDRAAAALAELQADMRRVASPGLADLAQLSDQARSREFLRERAAELQVRLQELGRQLAELHAAWLAADQEVRVLEKLRDRRTARRQRAQATLEIGRLQEAALRKVGIAPTADFRDK